MKSESIVACIYLDIYQVIYQEPFVVPLFELRQPFFGGDRTTPMVQNY